MTHILRKLMGQEPELIVLSLGAQNGGVRVPAKEGSESPAPVSRVEEAATTGTGERLAVVPPRPNDTHPRARSAAIDRISALMSSKEGLAYASEEYRMLRTRIAQLARKPFQLAITSPSIGDGKTVTAINLAIAMALRSEERALLIDADLRRAGIHRMLRVPNEPGLADVLEGSCRLEDAVFEVEELPGLYVLPAGVPRANPTEVLDSARWRDLAELLRQRFAQIIIDCPPVELVADYDLIATVCNGAVLVVRPDHTNRTLSLAAIEKLKPKLTGVVINAAPEWFLWKRPSHHGYYYYRADAQTARGRGDKSK
jgi:protein-tyrosine kinase